MNTIDSKLCLNGCGKGITKTSGKSGKFCSRSCAASYNNRRFPKRKPEHECATCNTPVSAIRKYCSEQCLTIARIERVSKDGHTTNSKKKYYPKCECGNTMSHRSVKCRDCVYNDYLNMTIGQLRAKSVRDAQVYNGIRQKSRSLAVKHYVMECALCGYDYHVDVCHVRALSSLPDETTVISASGVDNFVLLCRNHHWELDHGNIDIKDVPRPTPRSRQR